ncbi:MAG: response regulator [Verrucomicrobiota bacterium]
MSTNSDYSGGGTAEEPVRILVVDDDPGMLIMTKAVVESMGHEAALASSGEEAIELFEKNVEDGEAIGLVIMDLTMPGGMSGIEAMHRLHEMDEELRVIAASGYFEEGAGQRFCDEGFCAILPKPFTPDKLAQVVQWSLSRAPLAAG